MKTKIADAVLLAPTSAEAWHVNFYLFGFFPVPVWITVTPN
jgi:hypothetical protein